MSSRNVDGYNGKLLRMELTDARLFEDELNETVLRKYAGGSGFGAKFLYEEVSPDIEKQMLDYMDKVAERSYEYYKQVEGIAADRIVLPDGIEIKKEDS